MIKNIIFDFGGVVILWDPHLLYDGYFGDRDKAEWFLSNICTYEWNAQHDAGKSTKVGRAELAARYPEWEKEIWMYYDEFPKMIGGAIPGTLELIKDLKAKGYNVYGLTNWSHETFELVRNEFEAFSILDGMVVSGVEKLLKPDPAIYHCLLDRYGLKAEESVFLDDNADNIAGAKAVGMEGIIFRNAAQAREELEKMLSLQ